MCYKLCGEKCGEGCDEGNRHSFKPIYLVSDSSWDEEFEVDLVRHRCSCGQFEENGHPCVHALFVLHEKSLLDDVESFIMDGYRRTNVAKTCLVLPDGWMDG